MSRSQLRDDEWLTGDGEVLTPSVMETSHITNILNMLARRAQKIIGERAALHKLAGDDYTAQCLARQALSGEELRKWCLGHYRICSHLEQELERRSYVAAVAYA